MFIRDILNTLPQEIDYNTRVAIALAHRMGRAELRAEREADQNSRLSKGTKRVLKRNEKQFKIALERIAASANGNLGGRNAIDIDPMLALIEEEGDLCRADYYRCQYPREWRKARRLDRLNTWRDDTGIEYVEVGRQQ